MILELHHHVALIRYFSQMTTFAGDDVSPVSGGAVNDQTGDNSAGEGDCTASAADGSGERQARRLEEERVWLYILVSL